MARLTNKHARSKPHRLFEDSRYVPSEVTQSLLDESMWAQADTLNDDEHDSVGDAQLPHERNNPQVSEQSDLNPEPNSGTKHQDSQQGERLQSTVENPGGGISDMYDSYPRPGDEYVGRHEQLRNFPSDTHNTNDTTGTGSSKVNAQSQPAAPQGGVIEQPGTTDVFKEIKEIAPKERRQRRQQPVQTEPVQQQTQYQTEPVQQQPAQTDQQPVTETVQQDQQQTTPLYQTQAQLGQKVKDFGGKVKDFGGKVKDWSGRSGLGFDKFMQLVGDNDALTQEQYQQINKKLAETLMGAGVIKEPEYKINRQLYDQILASIQASGIEPSKLEDWQLEQAISGNLQQQVQQRNQPRQQPGAGGGAGTVPLAGGEPQQQAEPEAQPEEVAQPEGDTEPLQLVDDVESQEFDLSKIPNIAKKTLQYAAGSFGRIEGRIDELLNEVYRSNTDITVGQFLQMPFGQLPQPTSPGEAAAQDVEQKRGPYQEPMLTAQVHIPEETDPVQPAPELPELEEGEGRQPFTEDELQRAKGFVYQKALELEQQIAEQEEQQTQQPNQQAEPEQQQQPEEPQELQPETEQPLATTPLAEPEGGAPARATPEDFGMPEQEPEPATQPVQQPPQQTTQRPLNAPQKQLINQYLQQIKNTIPEAEVPAVESFEAWDQFQDWYRQQSGQTRQSIRTALKELGIDMPKIMNIEDVRRVSPKHAKRMEKHGIEWVEQEPFMQRLRKEVAKQVEASENPVKMVQTLRREGKSFNFINGEIINGYLSGFYDDNQRDRGHVALHRLAQKTVKGDFNITPDQLNNDVKGYIELMAAKSEITPKKYTRQAAKQIRATDYTLYNMKADSDKDDFNYADPWDLEWTLYRQTEGGKRGAQLDVMRTPSCAIMAASDHGDGKYLVRGISMLDEVYWGTYTINVKNGIVTQYAKVPVDKEGKRFASANDNDRDRIMSRRKYVALYRAMCKVGMINQAQINEPAPGWEELPQTDEEIERRMQKIKEWQEKQQQRDREVTEKIRKMSPRIAPVEQQEPGDFPSQEEVDQKYYEGMQKLIEEHPGMLGEEDDEGAGQTG